MTAKQIRQIRVREKASQAVFARYLNVTTGLVSQWERGEKPPRGVSLKLLTLVAKKGCSPLVGSSWAGAVRPRQGRPIARIEQGEGMVQGNFSIIMIIQQALEREGISFIAEPELH